jgi:transglutaminase-like putative cysteine protease
MALGRVYSSKKVLAQVLLLALPTVILGAYLLFTANNYINVLENQWQKQTGYFAGGLVMSLLFFSFRFRFITSTALLGAGLWMLYFFIRKTVVGEFDTIWAVNQVIIFNTLVTTGWICGYGLSRSRYFTVGWSVFLLAIQIVVVSQTTDIKSATLIQAIAPVLLYSFYIVYVTELIRNINEDEKRFAWVIFSRMGGFFSFSVALLVVILLFLQKDFKAIEQEWGGGQGQYDDKNKGKESMTKQNKDGSMQNKDQTQLTGGLSKGNKLVFVAKLDNFFEDGKTPNPLYFTAHYYTKFDTVTQTFEIDSLMPNNDLFRPDPSQIPLYFAKTDSSVLRNTNATLRRKVVTADVYKVLLSPKEYIAPSTAFFCQPIAVDNENKDQYKSAYRAKMWVSDLNSAYFVYNPAGNLMLDAFQQNRFNELRKVSNFKTADKKFFNYYTFMPRNNDYDRLRFLADSITKNVKAPIDKIIAIRDYFLSKDENGQPLFKYSDNPGVPGLPSANKLNYFLTENRKGYCAYFAGATLFMLRSIGIPSRVAAGFLTVDRSNKNLGWYWFYEDQAHAWVQVYFPGYGWIDFDTTVPDAETQESPQPDQTPPMNTQQAYFVANGKVVDIDTVAKKMSVAVTEILYHDKPFSTKNPVTVQMDLAVATIMKDTGSVPISTIKNGMEVSAISYAEAFKKLPPKDGDDFTSLINQSPQPAPIDQVKIMDKDKQDENAYNKKENDHPTDWWKVLWTTLICIVGVVLLALSIPWFIWKYFAAKATTAKNSREKGFQTHRAMMYYLHQLGFERNNISPETFSTNIDMQFGTSLHPFHTVYQKLKYSSQSLSEKEQLIIQNCFADFKQKLSKQIKWSTRFKQFINIYQTIQFFTQPKNI